jgi:hypothetical protein
VFQIFVEEEGRGEERRGEEKNCVLQDVSTILE